MINYHDRDQDSGRGVMGVREPKTGVNDVLSSGIEIGEEDQAEIGGAQSAILTERKLQKYNSGLVKLLKYSCPRLSGSKSRGSLLFS
jgi:hypothetical protein